MVGIINNQDKELYSHIRNILWKEKKKRHLSNSELSRITGVQRCIIVNFLNEKMDYLSFHNTIKLLIFLDFIPAVILRDCIIAEEYEKEDKL